MLNDPVRQFADDVAVDGIGDEVVHLLRGGGAVEEDVFAAAGQAQFELRRTAQRLPQSRVASPAGWRWHWRTRH